MARISQVWEELHVTWMSMPEYANPSYAPASFSPPVYDWLSGYAVNYGVLIDTDEDPTATQFSFASRDHEETALSYNFV